MTQEAVGHSRDRQSPGGSKSGSGSVSVCVVASRISSTRPTGTGSVLFRSRTDARTCGASDSSTGTPGQRSPRVLWWVPPTPGWGGRGGRHHSPTGVSGSRVPTAAAGSLQHSRWDCGGTSAIAWCAHDALTHLDAEPSSDHGRSFGCRMLQSSATYLSTPAGPSVGLLTAPNRPPKMRVGRTRSGWRSAPVTRRPGGSLHVGWHH